MCDLDSPSVYSQVWRCGQRENSCTECGRAMEPGYRQLVCSGLWEFGWATHRLCQTCARYWFQADRVSFCDLWDSLWECATPSEGWQNVDKIELYAGMLIHPRVSVEIRAMCRRLLGYAAELKETI